MNTASVFRIPYDIVGDKISSRPWRLPEICACCGDPPTAHVPYTVVHEVKYGPRRVKLTVGFQVPYCETCKAHAAVSHTVDRYTFPAGCALVALLFACGMYLVIPQHASSGASAAEGAKVWGVILGSLVGGLILLKIVRRVVLRVALARAPRSERCTTAVSMFFTGDKRSPTLAITVSGQAFAAAFAKANEGVATMMQDKT